jgi:hypothetical protein
MSTDFDDEIEKLRSQLHADLSGLRADQRETAATLRRVELQMADIAARLAPLGELEQRVRVLERAADRVGGFITAAGLLAGAAGASIAAALQRLLGP